MKTQKGNTFTTLLAVQVAKGDLYVHMPVPLELGDIDHDSIASMIPLINERITTGKKPGATFEKCLQRIELHRAQLTDAYVQLFETYQRMIAPPATRQSSANKAMYAMLAAMDDKMLRQYGNVVLNGKADDFVLPSEREQLADAIVEKMSPSHNGNGTVKE